MLLQNEVEELFAFLISHIHSVYEKGLWGWKVLVYLHGFHPPILSSEVGGLQSSPKTQNGYFLKNVYNDFDYILVIYGGHIPE
jgi:hypothetical protein